jgi:hypothetical protein
VPTTEAMTMPILTADECARLQYLIHQAREEARALELEGPVPDAADRIEIWLTEALKLLRLVEARGARPA